MTRKQRTPWGAYPHLPNGDKRWNTTTEPTKEEEEFEALAKALELPYSTSATPRTLPSKDERGIAQAGHGYRPYHKASRSRVGSAGNMYLHKAQGMTPFHSHTEEKILLHFNHLPRVKAIRAQYPMWNPDKLREYVEGEKRFPKSFVKTFDILLTVDLEGNGELTELIVDIKHSEKLADPGTIRRQERDRQDAERMNWGYRRLTEKTISRKTHYNNTRVAMYMCRVEPGDLERLAPDAARFAAALKTTKVKGSLIRVIRIVANRACFGWNVNEGLRYFAVAHYCGYLRWDHNHKLEYSRPMMLMKDGHDVATDSKERK